MQANASLIVQAFAQHLHMAGCRRAYGLAGEDHVELMAALDAIGVRYVRAYNESAAVLMAAADAQASGSFGVAIVSMSAGMSNAINGLTHAYMEQVPVLVVSGQQPAAERPFIVRQGFDVEALAKPVTKWQTKVATGTDVGRLLAKAVFVATERPCGPVYVELPADVGLTEARTDARWQPRLHQQAALSPHALPRRLDDAEFAHLDDVMASALRPLLIVGGRSHLDLAVPVADLARGRRMPVLVTPNQKGVVPPGSPYYTGVFLNGSPERQLLDQADRVLAVDLEAFDIYSRAIEGDGQIVSLSSTPIAETFIAFSEEFVGDPVDTLRRLSQSAAGARSEWTDADVRQYREGLRADLAKLDRVPGALSTTDAATVLANTIPADATVVADAGFSKPILVHLWEPSRPSSFYASNAFGTMGHALPTAIALKLHDPSRPTVAVMGDGSLLMRAGELQTAVDAGVDPVVVVFLDRSFTQIAVKQERRGLSHLGVDLPVLSAEAFGDAFGCTGADVHGADDLADELTAALCRRTPSVIGVHVDNSNANAVFGYLRG
jgi:acetolactate synthase I/II/III large subunit